jgi:uncharacterized membrane protein YkgB
MTGGGWWRRVDAAMIGFMAAWGIRLLRVCLGVVFIWFGALKIAGHTPVAALVSAAVPWFEPGWFLPSLGVWEVLVGAGLLFAVALRLTLLLFWGQMAGTFLVLLLRPDIAFQHGNPLLLTTEGEFVIKNLVLIAAGLVVGSTVRTGRGPGT